MSVRCSPGMDRAWSPVLDTSARAGMIKTEVRDDHPEWSRLMAAAQDGDAGAYRKLLHDITPLLRRVAARRLDRARPRRRGRRHRASAFIKPGWLPEHLRFALQGRGDEDDT